MTGNREIEERIRDLCHRLHRLNWAYHCGSAEVKDEVYDELKKELRELEREYPQLRRQDSPLILISREVHSPFPGRRHRNPMLSLRRQPSETKPRMSSNNSLLLPD